LVAPYDPDLIERGHRRQGAELNCLGVIPIGLAVWAIRCKEVKRQFENKMQNKIAVEVNAKLDRYVQLLDELKDRSEELAVVLRELPADEQPRQTDGGRAPEATEKQLAFMEKLNVEFPKNISKENASILIDQALEESRMLAVAAEQ